MTHSDNSVLKRNMFLWSKPVIASRVKACYKCVPCFLFNLILQVLVLHFKCCHLKTCTQQQGSLRNVWMHLYLFTCFNEKSVTQVQPILLFFFFQSSNLRKPFLPHLLHARARVNSLIISMCQALLAARAGRATLGVLAFFLITFFFTSLSYHLRLNYSHHLALSPPFCHSLSSPPSLSLSLTFSSPCSLFLPSLWHLFSVIISVSYFKLLFRLPLNNMRNLIFRMNILFLFCCH